jgi:hypothetical protein
VALTAIKGVLAKAMKARGKVFNKPVVGNASIYNVYRDSSTLAGTAPDETVTNVAATPKIIWLKDAVSGPVVFCLRKVLWSRRAGDNNER